MPTAIVIDGAYFLRRFGYSFPHLDSRDPHHVAWAVGYLAGWHLKVRHLSEPLAKGDLAAGFIPTESPTLYRTFFYDCPPLTKRLHYPISKRPLDLAKTEMARQRLAIHRNLLTARKVALRLGRLNEDVNWRPKPDAMRRWLTEGFNPRDEDFEIDVIQKGVDMRLGLDVAAMAFKKQVDQIVMVAGDGDFVPAAKLARREGIDVVLDPMGGKAASDLLDHADGVRECRMTQPTENIGTLE
ncbi:NYN domain-containing protein [Sphingomonas sp.]|uniref:NYN domain-containing protein n=1 Tax=Sphingomonas sp. TaxID=28214 RepID=UPI001B14D619|nr:NYN domain-containing protein [Sphingomonas sp.]MBO9714395.1 NYN domain-containing protein [Sphingomonas sp.]